MKNCKNETLQIFLKILNTKVKTNFKKKEKKSNKYWNDLSSSLTGN